MIVNYRDLSSAGDAEYYARLRDASGNFYDFGLGSWTGTMGTGCQAFLSEVTDGDPTTSLYVTNITVPTGGPHGLEVAQDSDGQVLGWDTTKDEQLGILGTLLGTGLSVADIVDGVWDEPLTGATHNVATSAGRRLRQLQGVGVSGVISGTLSNTGTVYTDLGTAYGSAFFQDQIIIFTSGSLTGQCRPILVYGGDGHMEFDEQLTMAPVATDDFDILPAHIHSQTEIADAVWEHGKAEYTDGTSLASILTNLEGTLIPNVQGTVDALLPYVGTTIPNAISNLQGTANAILTDTDVTLPALINALENLSAAAAGTAIWNYCLEERGNYTAQQIMSVLLSVIAGVTSGSGLVFKTPDGTSTRLQASVNSANERTGITITPGTGTGI